jgi:hypothetical protein
MPEMSGNVRRHVMDLAEVVKAWLQEPKKENVR